MKRVIQGPLVLSVLAIATLLILAASASAQNPLFPNVQPVRPNGGAGPYGNFYSGGRPVLFLPPGTALQLTPGQPPQFRQLLLPPNGNYSNRPYAYPATNGYGSSPYIRTYGGAGAGY
jgi:hypothetical protein